MRYFSVPQVEQLEAAELTPRYMPHVAVSVDNSSVLDSSECQLSVVDGQVLAVEPETASWAFLTSTEADAVRAMNRAPLGSLTHRWSTFQLADFSAELFRRGLIRIDGQRAVDIHILNRTNYSEGHLVELLVTEKCNLGCSYCLAGASTQMPAMTVETATRTVDLAFAMHEARSITFEFAGGEPFLRFPLLKTIVDYIQSHPARRGRSTFLAIQTNATLLDEAIVRWVKEQGIHLGISLDGDARFHNKSRPFVNGRGSFGAAIAGLRLLQRFDIPFGITVVLSKANVDSASSLLALFESLGIGSARVNPVSYLGSARNSWSDTGLASEEVLAFFIRLAQLIATSSSPFVEQHLLTMLRHIVSKRRQTRCMRGECGAGDSFQAVNAKGEIFPCGRTTQTPAMRLGSVHSELLSLSSAGARSTAVAQIRGRRVSSLADCRTCTYRQLCQAGCSAQAFERYGTVRHKSPECNLYLHLYPFLMRWLSFDRAALDRLDAAGYFDGPIRHVDRVFLE